MPSDAAAAQREEREARDCSQCMQLRVGGGYVFVGYADNRKRCLGCRLVLDYDLGDPRQVAELALLADWSPNQQQGGTFAARSGQSAQQGAEADHSTARRKPTDSESSSMRQQEGAPGQPTDTSQPHEDTASRLSASRGDGDPSLSALRDGTTSSGNPVAGGRAVATTGEAAGIPAEWAEAQVTKNGGPESSRWRDSRQSGESGPVSSAAAGEMAARADTESARARSVAGQGSAGAAQPHCESSRLNAGGG